ncbi:MAG: substrate-binding domain-containing protein [Clostridia bacterium]|nr:substrate-binding domain-containing protein [Clostridia bacterium]
MDTNRPNVRGAAKFTYFLIFIIVILFVVEFNDGGKTNVKNNVNEIPKATSFKIISSSENQDLDKYLKEYANQKDITLEIDYAGTLDIMEKLNSGEEYDAVWASNSMWVYMLENVSTSNSKSTSINPVVFGIKKKKAEELGFTDREIYTADIVNAIKSGDLKFSMSNPTQTNTGATAYLGLLTTLAGSPEVLREEHLQDEQLKTELISLFSGLERSSGSEDFLEELFINGDYEAVVTYEFSIININKQLEAAGKEPLYILYPVDGVSISDSPLAYIDHKDENKKQFFTEFQEYILSDEGQKLLSQNGRRTWYGGTNANADKTVFNPEWGIDTTKYIVPLKMPGTDIIKKALAMYQTELRKPIHTVFCLDYSGSMSGEGYKDLTNAMTYILDEQKASANLLQFASKDKITVIPFSGKILGEWHTDNGVETQSLINNILTLQPTGSTNIYDTSIRALEILNSENLENYNVSVILMTDGMSNAGSYTNLARKYNYMDKDIPIYSIMFGNAYEDELEEIANLTNAKVFDGKSDLLKAFKEVRGYN